MKTSLRPVAAGIRRDVETRFHQSRVLYISESRHSRVLGYGWPETGSTIGMCKPATCPTCENSASGSLAARTTPSGDFSIPPRPIPATTRVFKQAKTQSRDPNPIDDQCRRDANKGEKPSYFEAHPNGLRCGTASGFMDRANGGTNFCTSNPDAAEEFTKNYVQALIDGIYRGADVVNFWTLDDAKWCQCPRCEAEGTPTDRFLRLVHCFDRQVKKAQRQNRLNRHLLT